MKRYKKTFIGLLILLLILFLSFLYPLYGPEDFNKETIKMDNHGNVLGTAPFPPSKDHLLGTSRNGEDMHLLLIYGAKFTLLMAIGVALLRVVLGGIVGIIISFWAPFLKKYFRAFFQVFRYIPAIFLGIVILGGTFGPNDAASIMPVVSYQIAMLVFLGFPSVTIFTMDLINELSKTTYVQTSYLMGANHFHVIKKQMLPYFRSYSVLFSVQQLLSTLQLVMHLGIFGFFLGGNTGHGTFGYEDPPKSASLSNEWAGLIGQNLNDFIMAPWTIFTPIIGFFIVIMIVNIMKKELEENLMGIKGSKNKTKVRDAHYSKEKVQELNGPFQLLRKEQTQGF